MLRIGILLSAIAAAFSSCDSAIYDDQGDCTVHYRVNFRYTKNILNADAFGSHVTDVHLYVFDKQGRLVADKTEKRQLAADNDYALEIDVLPGVYDLIAWCEGESTTPDAVSFVIGGGTTPAVMSDLGAHLDLQGEADDVHCCNDIDRLYYGSAADVTFPDTYGTVDIGPVYLTRDTKHISVLLQNLDGSPIGEDEFTFAIEASNNVMDHLNNVVSVDPFHYRPWSIETTSASFDGNEQDPDVRVQTEANGLLAEFTTGRLVAGRTPRLVIRNSDGDDVIRIDLIRYLLLVKSKYEGMNSDQDYLDRYDDHTMMFFIDNGSWAKARVYINNWRVVPPQDVEF